MAVTLLTVYFCVAILIGMVLEDWDFTDTIYFSISTLTTVGYGDVVSHSTRTSRLVTAIFVFIGVSFIGFAVGVMVSDVLDNRGDAKNNKEEAIPDINKLEEEDLDISICGIKIPIKDVFYTQEMRRMRKQLVDSWILVSIILMLGAYSKIKWFDQRRFEGVAIGRFKSVAIGRFGDVNDHSLHPFHVTEHSFRRFGHANLFVFLMVHFDEMRCFGRGVGRV